MSQNRKYKNDRQEFSIGFLSPSSLFFIGMCRKNNCQVCEVQNARAGPFLSTVPTQKAMFPSSPLVLLSPLSFSFFFLPVNGNVWGSLSEYMVEGREGKGKMAFSHCLSVTGNGRHGEVSS